MAKKSRRLTPRQAAFCRLLVSYPYSVHQAALDAGYSASYARTRAHVDLMGNPRVKAELKRLSKAAETRAVLTAAERQKVLSAIASGNLVDYFDGKRIELGQPEAVKNPQAIRGLKVREVTDRHGNVTVSYELTLRDPVAAIHCLNRMTGDYAPEEHVITNAAEELTDAQLARVAQGLPMNEGNE